MTPLDNLFQKIVALTRANKQGKGYCPAHKDKTPSFSIDRGADGCILMKCHTGCTIDAICAAIPCDKADLFPPKTTQAQGKPKYNIDKTYYYKDESGTFLFQAVRLRLADPIKWPNEPKKAFKQRQPDGNGGWIWNLKGVRRVLYGLPDLIAADPDATVWIVEGEKDRDRLKSLGLVSTCNPMGAGKWRDEYSDFLAGRDCVVIEDNDDPGRKHAEEVCQSLSGKARSLRKLSFPDLPEHSDVSDWLDAGHDETELCQMADALPEWAPAQAPTANAQDPDEWEAPAPFYVFNPPDFPLDVLSPWKRSFVEGLASSTQTPPDLAALLSIAICGAAVARNVRIEARAGWDQPLNVYATIALASANRKSAVVGEVTRPLSEYERELIHQERERIAEQASEYRTLAGELAELEKRAAKETDIIKRDDLKKEAKAKARDLAARTMPVLPKLIVADVTSEVVATILVEQNGRIALVSAEGGVFENMAGRYSNGVANIDVWLNGHSGDDDLRVDRRDRSEHIEKPAITIGLAVQPDVLRGLIEKPGFRGRGLLGRFLYSLPLSTVGRRKIRPGAMSDEARRTYHQNIKRLAAITPFTNDEGETIPRLIRLSKDADDYLASFEEEIEPMLGVDGDLSHIGDWGGKLAGAALRLAGILHLAQHADNFEPGSVYLNGKWPVEVSADTMKNAIKIARYLIPHAQAAYAEMGADSKIEDAKFLLRWIEKTQPTEFTKREAFEGTKSRFKQVVAMEPALKALEDHGYIRTADSQTPNRPGRRPSEKFMVNPVMLRP
jgi:putative DNA primase/helicase